MRKTKSELWHIFLCNKLNSIEANIRTARTVRLAVIAITFASIGFGNYILNELFNIYIDILYVMTIGAVPL